MHFVVITHAALIFRDGNYYGYAPYIREMNLWFSHVSRVTIVCPIWEKNNGMVLEKIIAPNLTVRRISEFNLLNTVGILKTLAKLPKNLFTLFKAMKSADHIHLRNPGNVGLLGSMVQIFFPRTKKTAKYAGNWDWDSRQPWSYRLQQRILNNTSLTKNIKVLVYGNWAGNTQNILPFFTATYHENEKIPVEPRNLSGKIHLMFVGEFAEGKRPLHSCMVAKILHNRSIPVRLDLFGKGKLESEIQAFIIENELQDIIYLQGSQPKGMVMEYYQKAHFLVFMSKSEGWPKVVAESMFWGVLPITTNVSCVGEMVGHGNRGSLIEPNPVNAAAAIVSWLESEERYKMASQAAMDWSRQFTLERFDQEIAFLLGQKKNLPVNSANKSS